MRTEGIATHGRQGVAQDLLRKNLYAPFEAKPAEASKPAAPLAMAYSTAPAAKPLSE